MKLKSNPKKPEEYLKMFNEIFSLEEKLYPGSFNDFVEDVHSLIDNTLSVISKNSQIESYLKNVRAGKAWSMWDDLKKRWYDTEYTPFSEKLTSKEANEIANKLEKIWKSYLNSVGEPLDSYRVLNTPVGLPEIKHYFDLYNTDKNYFRPLMELSWVNKSIIQVAQELEQIEEHLLGARKQDIKEYKEKFAHASETEEYLKVDNKYSWYVIQDNYCPFESYLTGHCGTDRSSEFLFSLRSINKANMFDSHVTVSVSIKDVDKKKFGIDQIYIVHQVKGKRNQHPDEKYYPYIIELFKQPNFVFQMKSSYMADSDFSVNSLDKKDKEAFLKIKPLWNKPVKGLIYYDLLKDKKVFEAKYWKAEKAYFDEEGNFHIVYKYFMDMIDNLVADFGSSRKENDLTLTKQYLEDYIDDFNYKNTEIDVVEYYRVIQNKAPKVYKKLQIAMKEYDMESIQELYDFDFSDYSAKEEPNKLFLQGVWEAMDNAYRTGYEVGTSNERYKAIKNFYDELVLQNDQYGDIGTIMNLGNKDQDEWHIIFNADKIEEYSSDNNDIGIPYPSDDTWKFPRNGLEWDWDYDAEAAHERLLEELPHIK